MIRAEVHIKKMLTVVPHAACGAGGGSRQNESPPPPSCAALSLFFVIYIFRNIVAAIFRDLSRYSPIFSDIPEQLHAQGCRVWILHASMRRQPGHAS